MTRITNLAASNHLVNVMQRTQARLFEAELQVSTEKVSQDYAGIASESQRLLNLENTRDILEEYVRNNETMAIRLNLLGAVVDGARESLRDFRKLLEDYGRSNQRDATSTADIQEAAFRALKDLESYLNSEVDGRYLFAGSRLTSQPVDLGLTTLADFQAQFDGAAVSVETTRDANLKAFSFADDGSTPADTTWLVFERDGGGSPARGRITATTAQFANIPVGTTITVSGTGSNDGTYTVAAVTGTSIEVVTRMFTDEAASATATVTLTDGTLADADVGNTFAFSRAADTITAAAGTFSAFAAGQKITVGGTTGNDGTYTIASVSGDGSQITIDPHKMTDEGSGGSEVAGIIAATSYYNSDQIATPHRIDEDSDFTLDLTAVHPAFEKAIRALTLIAQGTYGTEGGLDENFDRVHYALSLLDSALDRTGGNDGPFGTELGGSIEEVQIELGYRQVLINDTNTGHQDFITFLDTAISDVEDVDNLEAITRMLDDSRALEASYQVLARIRQLSLTQFL